jgi:hypothetical protein
LQSTVEAGRQYGAAVRLERRGFSTRKHNLPKIYLIASLNASVLGRHPYNLCRGCIGCQINSFPFSVLKPTKQGWAAVVRERSAEMLGLECLVPCAYMAERRRQQWRQRPEDKKNCRAAAILDSLDAQVSALNGSLLHERIIKLWKSEELSVGERDSFNEIVGEELSTVGFTSFPATAKELLESIADKLERLSQFIER